VRLKRVTATILLLCLVLVGLDRAGLFTWPRSAASFVLNPVQLGWYRLSQGFADKFSIITQINTLGDDNLKLRDENDKLKADLAQLATVKNENDTLKAQLLIPQTKDYKMLQVQTLGLVPILGTKQLLLSAGSSSGVEVGQAVVVGAVIIGKITQTTSDRSTVRLLTDPQTQLLVITSKGAKGILVGQFQSSIKLTKVLISDSLSLGDQVLTSGEENWPKNFVVGEVTKVSKDSSNLFQETDVRPLVSYDKLSTVFILLGVK